VHLKLDRTSDRIAALALSLSILSSGFAVYQWWTSARDEHIRAAIEISNQYTEQAIEPLWVASSIELGNGGTDDALNVVRHYARLEYASYLANRGLVDRRYLSQFLICDIQHAPEEKEQISARTHSILWSPVRAVSLTEVKKFGERKDCVADNQAAPTAPEPASPTKKESPQPN
jgi:hypothetical protein